MRSHNDITNQAAESIDERFKLLKEYYQKNDTAHFSQLLQLKINGRFTIYEEAIFLNRPDILQQLTSLSAYAEHCTLEPDDSSHERRMLLMYARSLYWLYPQYRQSLDHVCHVIRTRTKNLRTLTYPDDTFPKIDMPGKTGLFSYSELTTPKSRATALAIEQAYLLFSDPSACTPYLIFLNDEFLRYHQETYHKDFPALSSDQYSYRVINRLHYPTPSSDTYTGIDKNSALQSFLMSYLQQFGIAKRSYQWAGYIPNKLADEMIMHGDFITEARINSGLFHGKLSHMLQIALITCAMNDGVINTRYRDHGELSSITIIDILHMLVSKNVAQTDISLWSAVLDSGNYTLGTLSYSDPFALHSIVMQHGNSNAYGAIADSMIDSFCKGILRSHKYIQKHGYTLSLNEFLDKLDDMVLTKFTVPQDEISDLKRDAISHFWKKSIYEQGSHYAVISKFDYRTNKAFSHRLFGSKSAIEAENKSAKESSQIKSSL